MSYQYVLKPRVKTPNTPSIIKDSYWRNVMARSRCNFHRNEPTFSQTATSRAYSVQQTIGRIAKRLGVDAYELYVPEVFYWHDKFVNHVQSGNNFAAYYSFAHMEAEAEKVSSSMRL